VTAVIRSFDALALRQMATRRLRVLLTAFGIVLGVGMVFGVLLLVGTIRHTFDELISSAWGKTDVVVAGKANGTMPQSTVSRLRAIPGVRDAGGSVGSVFVRLDSRGKAVKGQKGRMLVAGFDPRHSPYDFRMVSGRMIASGPELIVEKNWARQRGLGLGDLVAVATPAGPVRLPVVGIFRFSSDLSFGDQGFAGVPLAEARRLMDQPAGWFQIAVKATDRSQADELRARIAATLGSGFEVKTPKALSGEISGQLQALNVVLYFFSGIALFVGGFLILNSFNMTVLQRIREIGMLRTLGATRGMVVRSVLVEALAIGAVGTLLGLGLGLALSLGLIDLMKGIGLPVGHLHATPGAAIAAVLVGILATTAGALWPARRAGRVAPIQAALGSVAVRRRPSVRRGLIGVVLFLPGLLLGGSFWFGNKAGSGPLAAVLGVGGTMLMFVGITLAAPFLITPLVSVLARPMRRLFPTGGRLASDATGSNPSRTAATAVALTIGLSVIVVNSAISSSFLGTISDQVDRTYVRDFTLQPVGMPLDQGGGPIAPDVRKAIASMPEAAVVTPVRGLLLKFPKAGGGQPGLAMGVDPADFGKVDLTPIAGASRARALADLAGGGVIVNRAYATAAHLHVGSTIPLRGPGDSRSARVAGVLKTMTGFNGLGMQMSLRTMRSIYGATIDNELLVKARSDAVRPALGRRIDAYLARAHPNLESLSTADVKNQIKTAINQQFNLFNAIIAIAVIVSLLGVVNTLAMSVMERTREIGVLRALGASRWLVRSTMLDESLLITLSGALAGIAVGALIAFVWISGLDSLLPGIAFHFPAGATLVVALAAVLLGVLAAVLPARRAARLKPVDALSYE
jgi:putative ABC transport system permease protein